MGREGFEPSKAEPTDLQSAPFDHSGTCPLFITKANLGIRTLDPEITNHVLWPAELSWRNERIEIYTLIPIDNKYQIKYTFKTKKCVNCLVQDCICLYLVTGKQLRKQSLNWYLILNIISYSLLTGPLA